MKQDFWVATFTDLLKTFSYLKQELLFRKLHASGFSYEPLRDIYEYLNNMTEATKIGLFNRKDS